MKVVILKLQGCLKSLLHFVTTQIQLQKQLLIHIFSFPLAQKFSKIENSEFPEKIEKLYDGLL